MIFLNGCLKVLAAMVPIMRPNREAMHAAALKGYATATDLADYLVRKGLPFRDAHEIVGKAVARGIELGKDLAELSIEELQVFSDRIDGDVFEVLTLEGSVAARNHFGGTAPEQVRAAIGRARVRFDKSGRSSMWATKLSMSTRIPGPLAWSPRRGSSRRSTAFTRATTSRGL